MTHQNQNKHTPVLLNAVLRCLDPQPGETYLDVTAGYGGHAQAILERTAAAAVLVDRDQEAATYLRTHLAAQGREVVNEDFRSASQKLEKNGREFDLILADLGVSSPHLNKVSRGFSIHRDGPLDMRMDQRQTLTADSIVNSYSQTLLAGVIRRFGEEPRATRIARSIVAHRPIHSTAQLANVVRTAIGGQWTKIHPATKTFQALRIVVNDELAQVEQTLPVLIRLLKEGGRIGVITFHSLEDRLVKQVFAAAAGNRYDSSLRLVTKKPIVADENEIVFNPRSRSAKLRVAAKINT